MRNVGMHGNFATTISVAAVASGLSVALLSSRLARSEDSRHFRYASFATLAASVYAATDAVIAGGFAPGPTAWAGRIGVLALCIHGVAWLLFIAAWDRRALHRSERVAALACIVTAPVCLVPEVVVRSAVTPRALELLGVVYNDPVPGPFALAAMAPVFAAQVLAAVAAARTSRRVPRARGVAQGFVVYMVVDVLDTLSATGLLHLPYFASLAIMVVPAFVCAALAAQFVDTSRALADRDVELAGARAALLERERLAAVGQLAAVVAHEVRNPVAIIYGALAALRKGVRSPDDLQAVGIVEQEAQRLQRLVVQLLDSVRPFELQYTTRPIKAIVSEAVTAATSAAGCPPSEVTITALPDASLEGDGVLLGQAVLNLVANALDASGRRSPVVVRALVQTRELQVEITDDGDGVAEANAGRLFTPFFTTRATGTGLGLALVKRIAEAHGGSVTHEKPPTGGASFVMRVPLAPPARES